MINPVEFEAQAKLNDHARTLDKIKKRYRDLMTERDGTNMSSDRWAILTGQCIAFEYVAMMFAVDFSSKE